MKIFEIIDEENKISVGVLLYYEKEGTYIIELQEYLDEWNAPLLFTGYVKKQIYTIPRDISKLWVMGRIIPSGRQNIGDILNCHKLKEYDEMKFLEISQGRCCQDSMYINRLDELPEYVKRRRKKNLMDCVLIGGNKLLCFFANDTVMKVDLTKLTHIDDMDKILCNDALYNSGKVGTGGCFVTFNDSIDIPAWELYQAGETINLTLDDFMAFAKHNILDTTDACKSMECSRQNISYMVKQNQLTPVREDVKGNLYLKGDVLKNKW